MKALKSNSDYTKKEKEIYWMDILSQFLCITNQKPNSQEGKSDKSTLGHILFLWSGEQSSVSDSPIRIMWSREWAIS